MARPRLYHERRVATVFRLPLPLGGEPQAAAASAGGDVSVNLLIDRALREYPGRRPPLAGDQG